MVKISDTVQRVTATLAAQRLGLDGLKEMKMNDNGSCSRLVTLLM